MIRRIALLMSLIPALLTPSLCHAEARPLLVEATRLEYRETEQVVRAEGNVRLRYEELLISTPILIVHTGTGLIESSGGVSLTTRGYTVRGVRLRYNIDTQTGSIDRLRAEEQGIYFRGRHAEFGPEKVALGGTRLTTCNQEPPHYSLNAAYVELYPGDRLVLRNVTVYLFSIPIFWLPSYTYRFEDTAQPVVPEIGYSEFSGWFVKNTYEIPTATGASARLRLDYREKHGIAGGLWLQRTAGTAHTDLEFYQTRDMETRDARGLGRLRHVGSLWQNPDVLLRLNIDQLSDEELFADYLPELDSTRRGLLPSTVALDFYGGTSKALLQAQGHINRADTYAEFAPRVRLTSWLPTKALRNMQLQTSLEWTNFSTASGPTPQLQLAAELTDSWPLASTLILRPRIGGEFLAYQPSGGEVATGWVQQHSLALFFQARGQAGALSHHLCTELGYYRRITPDLAPPTVVAAHLDLAPDNFLRLNVDNVFAWAKKEVLQAQVQLDYRCTGEPHNLGPLKATLTAPLDRGKAYLEWQHDFYGEPPWYTLWGIETRTRDWYIDLNYGNYSSGQEFISVDSSLRLHPGLRVTGEASYDIDKQEFSSLSYALDAILHCLGVRLSVQQKPQWGISAALFVPTLEAL